MHMPYKQLPLAFHFHRHANFTNFVIGDNQDVVALLQQIKKQTHTNVLYLWGPKGVGKTHLLYASCQLWHEQQYPVSYLTLRDSASLTPAALEQLAGQSLIVLDDIDAVAGQLAWETALFHLYNAAVQTQSTLILSAQCAPRMLNCQLADWQSRLTASLVYQIKSVDDAGKRQILIERAQQLGLTLPMSVADYLLQHYSRDLLDLLQMLQRLDHASLASQRALTIPFIKMVLTEL
ncbi:MAG: DnaA regulatory inactivator Hda [Legionellales bacterium]|nr:DnaA regulatory inactivator Hda [Legionellales bacterium]